MPTETTLNSLKVHKVPDFETWEENYDQVNGIGTSDVVVIPPEELKKGILPDQTNNSGKFLTTDGNGNTSWANIPEELPNIDTSDVGKVLTVIGSGSMIVPHQNAPHNDDASEGMELPSYMPINVDLTSFTNGTSITIVLNGSVFTGTVSSSTQDTHISNFIGYTYMTPAITLIIGYFTNSYLDGKLVFSYSYDSPAPESVELTVTTTGYTTLWSLENVSSDLITFFNRNSTESDILAALQAGKYCVFVDEFEGETVYSPLTFAIPEDHIYQFSNTTSYVNNNIEEFFVTCYQYDSSQDMWYDSFIQIPDPTTIPQGTVTNVRVQASSPLQSSVSTAQDTSLDTTISFLPQNKNIVLAGPDGSTGHTLADTPTFRALVANDIPSLGNITNGGDITATAPTIANGDQIIINDNSASKITNGPTFDGSTTTKYLSQKGTWESVPTINYPVTSVNSKTGAVSLSASDVSAVATSAVGANSGVAPLNASGKIDSTYLPSYVDDVIEGYYYNSKFYTTSAHTTEITGETGKIFVDLTTNKTYRYGGSSFTEISQGSVVSVSTDLTSGTKIGTLTINGTGTDLYAPTPETFTVTGGASTIVSDNLTANRALVSNTNGKVAVSDVTSTELGYLDGVTSAIQTQIDGKQAKVTASGILKGDGSGGVSAATAGTDYQTPLTIDSTPTDGNTTHVVSSDGTYDKILARTKIYTASCSTGASTAAKVATLDDSSGFSLTAGVMVAVRFTNGNSAATPTLRVDGSTTGTAKTIVFNTAVNGKNTGNGTTYNTWGPYETVVFTYDGTYWVNGGSSLSIYNAYNKANSITASSLGALTSESDPIFSASAAAGITSSNISTWNGKQDALPSQTNNSGKFLTTNGSALSWDVVDALPSQTNNSGKFLTTNGTSASWATVSIPTVPTMDASPTDGNSSNTVSSNGVYDMIMGRTKVYTATCSTAAATAAKVATLDDSTGFSLTAGVKVAVTFTYGNSATTPTLNVNSSGAKTIAIPSSATAYTTGNGTTYNTWGAYETVLFTYTGTYWAHDTSGYLGYLAYNTASGRQAKITASGILKGDGSGTISAAVAGTDYQAPLPSQSGNSGKYLTTNGSSVSWASVDALPSQTGNSGKFLTTNGTTASWDSHIFIATSSTTNAQIDAAVEAGKICFYESAEGLAPLIGRFENPDVELIHVFLGSVSEPGFAGQFEYKFCKDDSWFFSSFTAVSASSPTFYGTPKAPTAAAGTNTTQIATTAFVNTAILGAIGGSY